MQEERHAILGLPIMRMEGLPHEQRPRSEAVRDGRAQVTAHLITAISWDRPMYPKSLGVDPTGSPETPLGREAFDWPHPFLPTHSLALPHRVGVSPGSMAQGSGVTGGGPEF